MRTSVYDNYAGMQASSAYHRHHTECMGSEKYQHDSRAPGGRGIPGMEAEVQTVAQRSDLTVHVHAVYELV